MPLFRITSVAAVFMIAVGFATFSFVSPAQAQQTAGIAVSPPSVSLTGDRGGSATKGFLVTNTGSEALEATTEVRNFTASGDSGDQPLFTSDRTGFELASWMSMDPAQVTIQPGESKTMTAVITIPQDAPPGGHFGSITFHPAKLATGGNIRIDQAVTSLVLLTVSGEVIQNSHIADFSTENIPDSERTPKSTALFKTGPLNFVLSLQNQGNVQVSPTIQIDIRNVFGSSVAKISDNDPGNTLPDSTRKYRIKWDHSPPIGRYTAKATLSNPANGQIMYISTSFWVIPMYAIVISCLCLALLIASFALTAQKRRRRKI